MTLNSINKLQQQLQSILGPEYNSYLENMQDWFGQQITKEFFDERMATILQGRGAYEVHNEMMKLIMSQCNGNTPTPAPTPVVTTNFSGPRNLIVPTNSFSMEFETIEHQNGKRFVIYESADGEDDLTPNQSYITVNLVEGDDLLPYMMRAEEVEKVKPIVPVDWLFNVDVVKVNADEANQTAFSPPENYSKFAIEQAPTGIIRSSGFLPSTTYGYDIADRLNRFPQLRAHFKHQSKDQPYLPDGSSIHGRFLLKAWECGLDGGVDPNGTKLVHEAVKICHSIGAPYPNPYLLCYKQGQHLLDSAYSSETTRMADVMQVPTMVSNAEELERIATLQIASAAPSKICRFPATKSTLADLLNVIENDPGIIPYTSLRFKLLGGIGQKYKGFAGTFSYDDDDNDDYDDHSTLLPICSY
ncbi:Transcriptional adapter 1 [Folsomia candida]|uniref:Transcriptional adapter 1 n=1 Tax=Folsomia candida TaxID=158441 RepID=A0A226EM54_FOLCA|nr:Transcriptional adapter 1 [Folsomia candida]